MYRGRDKIFQTKKEEGQIYPIPWFDVEKIDIQGFLDELESNQKTSEGELVDRQL